MGSSLFASFNGEKRFSYQCSDMEKRCECHDGQRYYYTLQVTSLPKVLFHSNHKHSRQHLLDHQIPRQRKKGNVTMIYVKTF